MWYDKIFDLVKPVIGGIRMSFISGILLYTLGILWLIERKYKYGILSMVAGLFIVFFVLYDIYGTLISIAVIILLLLLIKEITVKVKSQTSKFSKEAIAIRDKVKDLETNGRFYIKSEGMFWEIEISPNGRMSIKTVNPLCAEEIEGKKCMITIQWNFTEQGMYCAKCKKCVSKYSDTICWNLARKTLDDKIDKAKKEFGIK